MPSRRSDEALSEVIGFILILALIAALASLYLTYVVPAQGRELEIKHMAQVNDQFLQYKTSIDSLWINGQENVPISSTFTLGTVTGLTQGAFVIPIFQPYPSSGMMVVNGRVENITLSTNVLTIGFPGGSIPNLNPVQENADHLYVQLMTSDTSKGGGLVLVPDKGNWTIWLNVTRTVNPGSNSQVTVPPFPTPTTSQASISWTELQTWINNNLNNAGGWISQLQSGLSQTTGFSPSLTMTLFKNNNTVFSGLPLISNLQNNTWYTVDILDDAYGLRDQLESSYTVVIPKSTSDWISSRYPAATGYQAKSLILNHSLGSLEFRSTNNYWIQQNYYYQQGGVFLEQPDGKVAKVVPLISVTNKSGIPTIRYVDIFMEGSGNIGGTSPVQVISVLSSVEKNRINGEKLAQGIPNAMNVTIIISAQDASTAWMWKQTFSRIRQAALDENFPAEWISAPSQTGNTVQFTVRHPANQYSLFLDYTRVDLAVDLQSVAIPA
ncbi:MAG: hypothetical protein NQU46_01115 [Methanolinea sp.]|nr:hypothetical protein [Methanolinea sp.]